MRKRASLGACVVGLVLACLCPSAQGRSILLTLPRGLDPNQFLGSAVTSGELLYQDPSAFSGCSLRLVAPSGQDREVFHSQTCSVFAASSSLVAIFHPLGTATAGGELYTGPPSGPFALLWRCQGPQGADLAFAVDAIAVAYVDYGCGASGATPAIVIRDASAHPTVEQRLSLPPDGRVDYLSLAGRYAAYRLTTPRGQDVVVDDRQTGAQALRAPVESTVACGNAPHNGHAVFTFCGLSVQTDGKVAELLGQVSYTPPGPSRYDQGGIDDTCSGVIDWFSPSQPQAHRVSHRACGRSVSIAADRILFAYGNIFEIGVVDLAGHTRDLGHPSYIFGGFDGRQVFIERDTCLGITVVSENVLVNHPGPSYRDNLTCPTRVRRAVLYVGRHPRVLLSVTCRHGCLGPIVVGTANYADAASQDFKFPAGAHKSISIPLPQHSRLLRNAHKKKRVRIALNTFSYVGYDPRKPATAQARGTDQYVTATVQGTH